MTSVITQKSESLTENRSGIVTHPREIMDLRELFVILTYNCNANCECCIERNVHQKGIISDESFDKALSFAKEKGLTSIFLHGGEPTLHPNIVEYAKKAKEAGFLVKMFTNGIAIDTIRLLDGILDEIIFSYRGNYSLHNQKDWKTPLSLQLLVTQEEFPTIKDLDAFKSLNPSHLKYSMTPSGEINSNFKRYFEEIVKNDEIEALLQKSQEKLMRLRADKKQIPLDKVMGFY